MFPYLLSLFLTLDIALAIPVQNYPTANFNLGIPIYTGYLEAGESVTQTRYGPDTIQINFTDLIPGREASLDFTWSTFADPPIPGVKIGEELWRMHCTAVAGKGFEGVAEFTLHDQYPWITAGVNTSGVHHLSAGIECPEGECIGNGCKGQAKPLINTFLNHY